MSAASDLRFALDNEARTRSPLGAVRVTLPKRTRGLLRPSSRSFDCGCASLEDCVPRVFAEVVS